MKLQKYITERRGEFGLTERENQELRQILDILEDSCKYFIREWQKTKLSFLYRGSNVSGLRTIISIRSRKDRFPKDISSELHETFDDMFKAKFGWYARSEGVFCTSNQIMAKAYGHVNFFFPVGKYQYIWSPKIDDLYGQVEGDFDINDYEYFEYDWKNEYDIDSGNGEWSYNGDLYEYIDDIVQDIIDNDDDLSEDDWEDVKDEVDNEAEWVPEMSLEDYTHDMIETRKMELEDQISIIINSYKDKDLRGAIKSGHEIMFECKRYYLVNPKFENGLSELLGVPPKGAPKQLKLFPRGKR